MPSVYTTIQAVIHQHQKDKKPSEMKNRKIVMNSLDHADLASAIAAMDRLPERRAALK